MTVTDMCNRYFAEKQQPTRQLPHWYFCDNQQDADECARLVLQGEKRATSPSLWWHQATGEPIAKVGDLNVVTDWHGNAVCIIETVAVSIVEFQHISAEYAAIEGEGDKSLAYWKKVHWDYYHRELADTDYQPSVSMPIVCEEFNVVYPLPR